MAKLTNSSKDADIEPGNGGVDHKAPRTRSPNYPYLDLKKATEKLRPLYDVMRRHPAGAEVVIKTLGYGEKSSTGRLALAAMRAFGYLEDTEDGLVKLTKLALDADIDYQAGSKESAAALRTAALSPLVHKKLWERYRAELPGDDELRRHLIRDLGFNDKIVDNFIDEYKTTIDYSGLANTASDEKNDETPDVEKLKAGDYAQWTSQGVDQFKEPKQIAGLSEDGSFAFFSDSPTGIPIEQLSRRERKSFLMENIATIMGADPSKPPPNPFFKPAAAEKEPAESEKGFAKERFTLDEGPVQLTWPGELSAESVQELDYWVQGILRRARRKAGITEPIKKPADKP